MPKRYIIGEAIWQSTKMQQVPEKWRAEYANLLPLALATGTFEADPTLVWSKVYANNRPNIKPKHVKIILECFEKAKMIYRFEAPDGKIWGFFVGIDKPGRLPSASEKYKWERGAEVPASGLAKFLGSQLAVSEPPATPPLASRDLSSGLGLGSSVGSGSGFCSGSGPSPTDTDTEPDDTPTQEVSRRTETDTEPDTGVGEPGTYEYLVSLYNHLSGSKGGDPKGFRKLVEDCTLSIDEVVDTMVWAARMSDWWPKRFPEWKSSKDFCQAYTKIAQSAAKWDPEQIAKVRRAVEAQLEPVPEKEESFDDSDEIFGTVQEL